MEMLVHTPHAALLLPGAAIQFSRVIRVLVGVRRVLPLQLPASCCAELSIVLIWLSLSLKDRELMLLQQCVRWRLRGPGECSPCLLSGVLA
jgi:hypothetical protein